ncbi:MAG: hypothetical protein MJ066_00725 [Clostridia bacterium]|nr:hypothetical protein [Clostridia bacterium]
MDKFGILGLLSSILKSKTEENSNKNDDILNLSDNKKQSELPEKPIAKPMPLQNYMLSTINSHDEFVKRVMLNNKKQNDTD